MVATTGSAVATSSDEEMAKQAVDTDAVEAVVGSVVAVRGGVAARSAMHGAVRHGTGLIGRSVHGARHWLRDSMFAVLTAQGDGERDERGEQE